MFLSIFPSLLLFQYYAPLILRVALGVIFVDFGWAKLTTQKTEKARFFDSIKLKPGNTFVWIIALTEIVSGIFLIAGFLTQIGALVVIIISLASLYLKKKYPSSFASSFGFLFLIFIISLSLILTGPGKFALDLPL